MLWSFILHFYQPPNQDKRMVTQIVNECYRPLVQGLLRAQKGKLSINMAGTLTEQLARYGYHEVLNGLRRLAKRGSVEFLGSAKYHAFLPLLPAAEVRRQIMLNNRVNRHYFGNAYRPKCFFSPEIAFSARLAKEVRNEGFASMLVDEVGYNGTLQAVPHDRLFALPRLADFALVPRSRRLSEYFGQAYARSLTTLNPYLEAEFSGKKYMASAIDGETFGHHRPGMEKVLYAMLRRHAEKLVTVSELVACAREREEREFLPCTWSSDPEAVRNGIPYQRWNHPDNPIHRMQWDFTRLALREIGKLDPKKPATKKARRELDAGLNSCHYWWASARPWWSLEMLERGAWHLHETLAHHPDVSSASKRRARKLYDTIIHQGFDWQRTGYVRKLNEMAEPWRTVPLRVRTPAHWFNQIVLEFESEMRQAARNLEYEKAAMWRDAVIRLRKGFDVYDVVHAVDQLHAVRTIPAAESFLTRKKHPKFAQEHYLPVGAKVLERERRKLEKGRG
ncbi:MAG: hypothetical protein COT39_01430 [Parcubacteria group bacterium CG08_land_8_20_14_0_20_48_21]|nr:MAG: hypothetical protein COT39_01430 [Parcubacteria group bacterium CG08_land_8_20_14_0_20_48_21]